MLTEHERAILECLRDAEHDVLRVTYAGGLGGGRLVTPGDGGRGLRCTRFALLKLGWKRYLLQHGGTIQITAAGREALRAP